MKKNFNVKTMTEIAICAAIAFVLDFIQGSLWNGAFPNGGSIGFAMVPIFVIAYRRGLVSGVLCGFILSIVQMLGGIYVINSDTIGESLAVIGITNNTIVEFFKVCGPFIQVMLDYILGYTLVGLAGVFAKKYAETKKINYIICGSLLGSSLKYVAHILSGLFFWPGEIFGISGGLYSFIYNGLYSIPNIIICTVIMFVIAKFYPVIISSEKEVE